MLKRLCFVLALVTLLFVPGCGGGGGNNLPPTDSHFTDLGTFGGTVAIARGMNDAGQVVGEYFANGTVRAFLWSATAGMQNIGTLGGDSVAFDINNAGQVVGASYNSSGARAFLWTPAAGMRDLGSLGGLDSSAHAINDAGQVVGETSTGTGARRAFLWSEATGMQSLGSGTYAAWDINNAGQVVGDAQFGSGYRHAFVWSPSTGIQDLGTIGGDNVSSATAVNDLGEVVGYTLLRGTLTYHLAFRWTASTGMQDLGPLCGFTGSVNDINNHGQVLSDDSIWTPSTGEVQYIGTLNGEFIAAEAINNAGQVVGYSAAGHAFLWSP